MDTPEKDVGKEGEGSARPYKRELRIPRSAAVVAQGLASSERSWVRVELKDSSEHGLGLRTLAPFAAGSQVALSVIAPGASPEVLRCSVQHCTKLSSGKYDVGVKILERMPGNLNTVRIPEAWRSGAGV